MPSLSRSLEFLREIDKLKSILRRTRLTFDVDRCENDAEHSWHLAMMAITLVDEVAEPNIDLLKVLRMVLVHDLVEIDAGDTFVYDDAHRETQEEREKLAAERIFGLLDEPVRSALRSDWEAFEARLTPEARYARALDRAQPILQNVYTKGASWQSHNISIDDVRKRNGHFIQEGAPALWVILDAMLEQAVREGWLRPSNIQKLSLA